MGAPKNFVASGSRKWRGVLDAYTDGLTCQSYQLQMKLWERYLNYFLLSESFRIAEKNSPHT